MCWPIVPNGTDQHIYAGAESLFDLCTSYQPLHGYIAAIVCVLGIIANGINIVVLTRRHMISSTNWILSAMALSDGLTMLAYLPYALYFYVNRGFFGPEKQTKLSAHFLLFYAHFSVVVHSVSIWLTVTLAIFRYLFIKYPSKGLHLCSIQRAKIATFATCVSTLIVCIPNFLILNVTSGVSPPNDPNGTIYYTINPRLESEFWTTMYLVAFWMVSIFIKFLPCILLTVMSILLIKCMREADQRRKNLRNVNARGKPKPKDEDESRDRKTNRTTRMLVAVVVLFLICELPQGILGLLVGILGNDFGNQVYNNLGDILDITALFNNGINFVLYCTMSKQFRTTFVRLFLDPMKRAQNGGHGRFTLVDNQSGVTNATHVNHNTVNTKSTDV